MPSKRKQFDFPNVDDQNQQQQTECGLCGLSTTVGTVVGVYYTVLNVPVRCTPHHNRDE